MTRPYEFEIEVCPVTDDGHARRVLELLRAEGLSIEDDNYCAADDGRGYVFRGMTELCAGASPEEAHEAATKTLGPAVQVTSRWRDLDPTDWDEEYGPSGAGPDNRRGPGGGRPVGDELV